MSSLCSAAYGRKLTRAEVRARRTKTKSETLRVRQDDGLVLHELPDTDVGRVERESIPTQEPRTPRGRDGKRQREQDSYGCEQGTHHCYSVLS